MLLIRRLGGPCALLALGLALLLCGCEPGRYGTKVVGLGDLSGLRGPVALRVSAYALDASGRVRQVPDDGGLLRAAADAVSGRTLAQVPWGSPQAAFLLEVHALCLDPRHGFEAHGHEALLPPAESVRPFGLEPEVYAFEPEQGRGAGCEGRVVLVLREAATPFRAAVGRTSVPCPAIMGCPFKSCRDSLTRALGRLVGAGLGQGH